MTCHDSDERLDRERGSGPRPPPPDRLRLKPGCSSGSSGGPKKLERRNCAEDDHRAQEPSRVPFSSSSSSMLLKWSDKQAHILTGAGRSTELYQPPVCPFAEDELPHFHKARGSTHEAFQAWRRRGTGGAETIAGAWRRPLFVGGWTHSDDTSPDGETTYNLQTPSVFLDIRVPKAATVLLGHHRGFHTMTDLELRLFARRHAFAGYTCVEPILHHRSRVAAPSSTARRHETGEGKCLIGAGAAGVASDGGGAAVVGLVATRHHAIDWNYVGKARPRPNKWRVEMGPDGDVWKEWGFAKDEFGQHVYMERWQRLQAGGGPFLALRRRRASLTNSSSHPRPLPDALLVICGDHFGLVVDRPQELMESVERGGRGEAVQGGVNGWSGDEVPSGLVELVDAALKRGDRQCALEFLSLEASHGRLSEQGGSPPWTVDCSLHPWLQGSRPLQGAHLVVSWTSPSSPPSAPIIPEQRKNITITWRHGITAVRDSPAADTSATAHAGRWRDNTIDCNYGGGAIHNPAPNEHFDFLDCNRRRWTGAPLEGVWDVVESTLSLSPGSGFDSLKGLLKNSGACVAEGNGEEEEQEEVFRAKL